MELIDAVNEFYYQIAIQELKQMHEAPGLNGVSYHSMMVLDIISYKDNCTISSLAEMLHVSKAAVTMKVNELQKQGLVIKEQSREDKRVHYLTVNREVRERYQMYDKLLFSTEAWLRQQFSTEEIDTFSRVLTQISRRYAQGGSYG